MKIEGAPAYAQRLSSGQVTQFLLTQGVTPWEIDRLHILFQKKTKKQGDLLAHFERRKNEDIILLLYREEVATPEEVAILNHSLFHELGHFLQYCFHKHYWKGVALDFAVMLLPAFSSLPFCAKSIPFLPCVIFYLCVILWWEQFRYYYSPRERAARTFASAYAPVISLFSENTLKNP